MVVLSSHLPVHDVEIIRRAPAERSDGMNRLFAAAVVNKQFCELLLKAPQEALQQGYLGEKFLLTPEELDLVISIRARSLSDLARQIYPALEENDT